MNCSATLFTLLLALVLAEDDLNMTLYGTDFTDVNVTFLDNNETTWSVPSSEESPSTKLPMLPVAGALIGQITTKAAIIEETTKRVSTSTTPITNLSSALTLQATTVTSTVRPSPRIYLVEHHHRGYGPFFEDGEDHQNVTARVGSTVRLDCKIGMLHDKTVTWLHRKSDSIHLLTVGRQAYSSDQRITLSFRYPSNWRLEILYVTRRDAGQYECQVATHPTRVKTVFLTVTAPEVIVMDEKSHETSERYYKAGSAVELTCLARHIEPPTDTVEWRLGTTTITSGVSFNKSLGENTLLATLTIPQGNKMHSGNYTCAVGSLASAVVAVHILNGELPAAVHGNRGELRCATFWFTIFLSLVCALLPAR